MSGGVLRQLSARKERGIAVRSYNQRALRPRKKTRRGKRERYAGKKEVNQVSFPGTIYSKVVLQFQHQHQHNTAMHINYSDY